MELEGRKSGRYERMKKERRGGGKEGRKEKDGKKQLRVSFSPLVSQQRCSD